MDIFTIFILPIREHGIAFNFFMSSSVSFIHVLCLFSLMKCIPGYFILFDAIVHGKVFKCFLPGRYLPAFHQQYIQSYFVCGLGTARTNSP